MAYNNYSPYGYNYPMPQQNVPYNAPQSASVGNQPMQIQNGGFISVRNIDEARNYPVAHGNSVTFKDEYAPYVYTKTMGFSQLDRPTFEVFRLVKEDDAKTPQEAKNEPQEDFATVKEVDAIRTSMKHLRNDLDTMKARMEKLTRKEVEYDE